MGGMNDTNGVQKTVILELLATGDGLSGRALSRDGGAREFSGRIGLMRAIDELVDAGPSEGHPPEDRRSGGPGSANRPRRS
jgi:hypothetical protein